MAQLKEAFSELGLIEPASCLNSGNLAFSSQEDAGLENRIRSMIKDSFNLDIPVLVILQSDLQEAFSHAPDWWGGPGKESYHNLIFLLPPLSYAGFCAQMGQPKAGLEQEQGYKNLVFWSFDRKDYQKTNWWSKTATAEIKDKITIRTAGTVRKLVSL